MEVARQGQQPCSGSRAVGWEGAEGGWGGGEGTSSETGGNTQVSHVQGQVVVHMAGDFCPEVLRRGRRGLVGTWA